MCANVKYGIWNMNQPDMGAVNALVGAGYAPLSAMVLACRGIQTGDQAKKYLDCNAPLLDPFLMTDMALAAGRVGMAIENGEKIAVGADVKNGKIAVKGWLEESDVTLDEFFEKMQKKGVKNIICTDISRDGAMRGTNLELYRELSEKYSLDITASGGVSSLDDVKALRQMNLYGAIIGKAYYTGAVDLKEAIEVAD